MRPSTNLQIESLRRLHMCRWHICMYTYINPYIHICIYIYIHIQIYSYRYTYISSGPPHKGVRKFWKFIHYSGIYLHHNTGVYATTDTAGLYTHGIYSSINLQKTPRISPFLVWTCPDGARQRRCASPLRARSFPSKEPYN